MPKETIKNLNDLFSKYVRGLFSFSSRFSADYASEILKDEKKIKSLEEDIRYQFEDI